MKSTFTDFMGFYYPSTNRLFISSFTLFSKPFFDKLYEIRSDLLKKKPLKKPLSPKIPDFLPLRKFTTLIDDEIYSKCLIEQLDCRSYETRFISFEQTQLNKCTLSNLTMRNFEVADTIFDHCDFSNTEMIGASFHRVLFKNCKLIGTNFAESVFVDCQFEACLADFSSFSYASFKVAALNQSSFIQSDFFEINWQHLTLENCDFTAANWFNLTRQKSPILYRWVMNAVRYEGYRG